MRIFDGVELKPPLSPTMQGAISWALLIANTLLEAGNCCDERLAREAGATRPTTLGQVMQQSGLRIPGIEEALEQLMGGTEEAKQAAQLLVNNPDPAVLLQKFAEHFGVRITAEPAAPPPGPSPAAPTTASPTAPPCGVSAPSTATPPNTPTMTMPAALTNREPPVRAAEAQAAVSATDASTRPPQFRADFTREAREAAKSTASSSPAASGPRSPESAVIRPLLVEMVERQLGALRSKMEAHPTELEARLRRAEAELDALRERLRKLAAARRLALREVPPQASEPILSTMPAAVHAPPVAESLVVHASENALERSPSTAGDEGGCEAERIEHVFAPLPHAATEEEVVRAVELIGAFGDGVEAQHRQSAVRLTRIENEIRVISDLVARAEEASRGNGEALPEEMGTTRG